MSSQFCGKAAVVVALLSFSFSAFAWGHKDGQGSHQVCHSEVVSTSVAGPANYHQVYAAIQNASITIQDFTLRLEDGTVIPVNTNPTTINLLDLSAFGKGLLLDLTQVTFPGGANTIQVAEIDVNLLSSPSADLISSDNSHCALGIPKSLQFYTNAAITFGHDAYHVKVPVAALNAIQINEITTVTQQICCSNGHSCHHEHGDRDDDHDGDHDGGKEGWQASFDSHKHGPTCAPQGEPTPSTKQRCKLVNRRYVITAAPLAKDDSF